MNPAWEGWKNPEAAAKRLFDDEMQISTSDPRHFIFHEVAHNDFLARGINQYQTQLGPHEKVIATQVSMRATRDRDEFLAEVKAALMTGKSFPQSVMALYRKLGGE